MRVVTNTLKYKFTKRGCASPCLTVKAKISTADSCIWGFVASAASKICERYRWTTAELTLFRDT